MKKQPELTALTRQNLVDAYFTIVARGERATVGAITGQAGYNRCTFYRYFTDTEQLLSQVEEEICNAFQGTLHSCSPLEWSSAIIESMAGVYDQYGKYISVLLGKNGDIRFGAKMKEMVAPIARQLFADESEVVTELKVEFVLSAVLAVITKWYEMEQPITAVRLGLMIKDILNVDIT